MFDPAALHTAIQQSLADSDMPSDHGFAVVVDATTGAQVALATRFDRGWSLELDAGYQWAGPQPGASAQFVVSKHWS